MSVFKRGQFWALWSDFEATAGFAVCGQIIGKQYFKGVQGAEFSDPLGASEQS